jgi:predicted XRE-type DNA-binding protein
MTSIQFDNIFDAIMDNSEKASELQTRADLMGVLRDIVQDKNWKQAEAAEKMGPTEPRVTSLHNGKIDEFSIDLLIASGSYCIGEVL